MPPVWTVGCLHLHAFNHQPNWTPIGILIDQRVRRYAGGRNYRPLRNGLMPPIILLARLSTEYRPEWLEREYFELTDTGFSKHGIQVWIRRRDRS